ncbi:barstar family protein [Testudinibacter sp. P80/BLE/0925]|uniref:barstar family protein n=1 Tax=Testudinibacter sp. TW-1 TaxID=3417757 RepID=UPI003D361791
MNNIKHIYIDGNNIKDTKSFHKKIGDALNAEFFIHGYGYNLDALRDVMSMGAGLNSVLYWCDHDVSKKYLGDDEFYKIVNVLTYVASESKYKCEVFSQYKDKFPFKFYLE